LLFELAVAVLVFAFVVLFVAYVMARLKTLLYLLIALGLIALAIGVATGKIDLSKLNLTLILSRLWG